MRTDPTGLQACPSPSGDTIPWTGGSGHPAGHTCHPCIPPPISAHGYPACPSRPSVSANLPPPSRDLERGLPTSLGWPAYTTLHPTKLHHVLSTRPGSRHPAPRHASQPRGPSHTEACPTEADRFREVTCLALGHKAAVGGSEPQSCIILTPAPSGACQTPPGLGHTPPAPSGGSDSPEGVLRSPRAGPSSSRHQKLPSRLPIPSHTGRARRAACKPLGSRLETERDTVPA